jgi:hypothetical protein
MPTVDQDWTESEFVNEFEEDILFSKNITEIEEEPVLRLFERIRDVLYDSDERDVLRYVTVLDVSKWLYNEEHLTYLNTLEQKPVW